MGSRDVLRWDFPAAHLLVIGIALAGFSVGVLDAVRVRLGRWLDAAVRGLPGEPW